MSRTHEQNLECIRWNLERAEGRLATHPTDWNVGSFARLRQAETDYRRYMAGEIKHYQMCHTAIELTTEMPEWGTRGT